MSSFNYPVNDEPDEPVIPVPPEDPAEVDDPEDSEPDEGADARLAAQHDDRPAARARHRADD